MRQPHTRPLMMALGVLLMLIFAYPEVALAEDVTIGVGAPTAVTVGDTVEIKAIVTSGEEPVSGAVVELTYHATFAGETGTVVLDRESTDVDGVAILVYEQRAAENGGMQVVYVGPEDIQVAPVTFDIDVHPAGQQQHRSESGVSIPWLNGWVVIAIIMIVWGLISYSAIQLVLVGRGRNDGGSGAPGLSAAGDAGSTWLAMAFAIVAVVTAVGMVIVFVRNPVTHNNLETAEGYDRTPVAFIDEEFPFTGLGLADPAVAQTGDDVVDGEAEYFSRGCAGCHSIGGTGGVVGPELVGEIGSLGGFTEDLREGPKGMPAYTAGVLGEDEIARIHAYLKSLEER